MCPFSPWAAWEDSQGLLQRSGPGTSQVPRGASAAQGSPQHPQFPCAWPGWLQEALLQVDLAGKQTGLDTSLSPGQACNRHLATEVRGNLLEPRFVHLSNGPWACA